MSKELDEKLVEILDDYWIKSQSVNYAISDIKAAVLDSMPKKINVTEFNTHMKDHIYGYNQAIKDITEKIK